MKNNKVLIAIAYGLVFILYNIIAFAWLFTSHANFWIGYSFTLISFIMQIVVFFILFSKKIDVEAVFKGIPLLAISYIYGIIQLIFSIIIMKITFIPVVLTIVIEFVILISYLVIAISTIAAFNAIDNLEKKTKQKVFFIKSLEVDVQNLVPRITDDAVSKKVESLVEIIKYSDPMSDEALAGVEGKIDTKIEILKAKVLSQAYDEVSALCDELELLFGERNSKCKLLK